MSLSELINNRGTYKYTTHSYLDLYEKLLQPIVQTGHVHQNTCQCQYNNQQCCNATNV